MRKTITLKRLKKALFFSACALLLICAGWWLFTPRPPLLEDVPFSVAVYDRHSNLMRLSLAADDKYRIHTPLKKIAPSLREATLLYEDRYFYSHWGVNPIALLRAFYTTYIGGDRRMGASTISMQLARLRLNLDTTGIFGKLHQIERAFAYERHYSKDEIFEAYLNLAPYGGNIEGCGAAARIYFQKSPERLDLIESLSLVSVPQNPARRNPLAVRRMDEEGRTDAALEEARSRIHRLWLEKHPEDAGSSFMNRVRLKVYRPSDLPFNAPHVTTEALQLFPGSTGVRTTIDHRMQQLLERMIDNMVRRNRDIGVSNASALLVHWPSMEVRALVGSADFFNPAIEGQVDGTRARRSPGSTLKPFIYALALDQGLIHPRTLLYDTPRSFKGYDPENADQQFKGPVNATAALQMSRNIPAISLANALGKTPGEMDLYSFLRRAGVDFPYGRDHYGLTLVLGGAEVSMRELAELYAILPNKGKKRELVLFHPIAESGSAGDSSAIIDLGATTGSGSTTGSGATVSPEQITGEGGVLPAAQAITQDAKRNTAPAAGTTQVRIANNDTPAAVNQVAAQAASDAASAVNHTSNPDTSHAADRLLSPEASLLTLRMIRALPANQRMPGASVVQRIPMYWKTGTSNGARDAWTAGVFGPYVLVVWVGNFNNQANPHFVGVKVAAPLFWDIADAAYSQENMRDIATRDLHMPDYNGLNLTRVKVCSATGDIDASLCRETAETWFIPGVSPIASTGVYRQILIDKATGLRACVEDPTKTERVVREFWPTDMLALYRAAGIIKPSPPAYLPECESGYDLGAGGFGVFAGGTAPEILSPKEGVTYHRSVTHPENTVISLHASGDADVTDFYWFSGSSFIGRSNPNERLLWTPPGGTSSISVVDNFGRRSSIKIVVRQSE